MRWLLSRQAFSVRSTQGILCNPDNVRLAYTLERPTIDQCLASPYHAVPLGIYRVSLYNSPKFGRLMPLLVTPNLPPNTKIELHWGNFAENSEGCILVGSRATQDAVWQTRETFEELFPTIQYWITQGGGLEIEIANATPVVPLHVDLSTQV
jgi:hypothetical protein